MRDCLNFCYTFVSFVRRKVQLRAFSTCFVILRLQNNSIYNTFVYIFREWVNILCLSTKLFISEWAESLVLIPERRMRQWEELIGEAKKRSAGLNAWIAEKNGRLIGSPPSCLLRVFLAICGKRGAAVLHRSRLPIKKESFLSDKNAGSWRGTAGISVHASKKQPKDAILRQERNLSYGEPKAKFRFFE